MHSERTRDKGHKLKEKIQSSYVESLLDDENSQARLQVAQIGCAVAILGGFQNQSRQSPEQPGLISQLSLL